MVQYVAPSDGFTALADPTRRGILEQLGHREATISDLATRFEMTLTGIKKHVHILEEAGLVNTEKRGRTRHCRLGPNLLDQEREWIDRYRQMLEARMDRLGAFLERTESPQTEGDRDD
jgi:DNA-binding transcriptional ArsR family regulator